VAEVIAPPTFIPRTGRDRNRGAKNLTPHGTARIHGYRDMWAMDIACGEEGARSTVLVRAGLPVAGIDIMAERRSLPDEADRSIKQRKQSYEKKLCNAPCKLAEGLGIYPELAGASLLKRPFRLLRPAEPVIGVRFIAAKGMNALADRLLDLTIELGDRKMAANNAQLQQSASSPGKHTPLNTPRMSAKDRAK
jgi:hypothetical protein